MTDNNERPYPLIPNPTMFSINGFNYVIDTNRVPHAIVGNNNVSPLSTDVTVQNGLPVAELDLHAQRPGLRLRRGCAAQPAGDHGHEALPDRPAGADVQARFEPDLHAQHDGAGGRQLRGNGRADRHDHRRTVGRHRGDDGAEPLCRDERIGRRRLLHVQERALHADQVGRRLHRGAEDLHRLRLGAGRRPSSNWRCSIWRGTTYLVTDGTTAGFATAGRDQSRDDVGADGDRPARDPVRSRLRLRRPADERRPSRPTPAITIFQFSVTGSTGTITLYNILYTAGGDTNMVQVNVPDLLPSFTQAALVQFLVGDPLTSRPAATTPSRPPSDRDRNCRRESFAGAFKTPLISTDPSIDHAHRARRATSRSSSGIRCR